MCLASKQHERHPINGKDLDIFMNICTAKDLRIGEQNTLFTLQWDANCCTALTFIDLLLTLVSDNTIIQMLRKTTEDLFDIAISDYNLIGYNNTTIGVSCLVNACYIHNFDIKPLLDGLYQSGIEIDINEDITNMIMNNYRVQISKASKPSNTSTITNGSMLSTSSTPTELLSTTACTTPASTLTGHSSPHSADNNTPISILSSTENSQDSMDVYAVKTMPTTTLSNSNANHSHTQSRSNLTQTNSTNRHYLSTKHMLSPIRDDMMDTMDTDNISNYKRQHLNNHFTDQDYGNRSTLFNETLSNKNNIPFSMTSTTMNSSLLNSVSTTVSKGNVQVDNTDTNFCTDDDYINHDVFYVNDGNNKFDMIDDIHAFSVSVTAELLGNENDDDTLEISHSTITGLNTCTEDISMMNMDLSFNTHNPSKILPPTTTTTSEINNNKNFTFRNNNNKHNYFGNNGTFPSTKTAFQQEYGFVN